MCEYFIFFFFSYSTGISFSIRFSNSDKNKIEIARGYHFSIVFHFVSFYVCYTPSALHSPLQFPLVFFVAMEAFWIVVCRRFFFFLNGVFIFFIYSVDYFCFGIAIVAGNECSFYCVYTYSIGPNKTTRLLDFCFPLRLHRNNFQIDVSY